MGKSVFRSPTSDGYHNPAEGPSLLALGILGTMANLLCLAVLQRSSDLKLARDYLCLLRLQSVFDLLYLLTSTPVTALPYLGSSFRYYEPFVLPWVFPFMQIAMTASIYTTIALAAERFLSIRDISVTRSFPVRTATLLIVLFSVAFNLPRFFELRAVRVEKTGMARVNNTGNILLDYALSTVVRFEVQPTEFYTVGYFLGYNMVGSFLVSLFVPVVTLGIFNSLIWRRLRLVRRNRNRLGLREKRNARATYSLFFLVIFFFVCHSIKLIVSGYQVRNYYANQACYLEIWGHVCFPRI